MPNTDTAVADITLYHGDNGQHEFWECPEQDILIIKHRGSPDWFVPADGYPAGPLSAVVRDLSFRLSARIILDPSKEYTLPHLVDADGREYMALVDA